MSSRKKYKGPDKLSFRRNIHWAIDQDYVSMLIEEIKNPSSPDKRLEAIEALEFIVQFNKEYYGNMGLKDRGALHKKKLRKSVYDAMNASNRDLYGIKNTGGAIVEEDIKKSTPSPEDALIEFIDIKKSIKN